MTSQYDGQTAPRSLDQQMPSPDHVPGEPSPGLLTGGEETRRPRYLALRSLRKIKFLRIADIAWVDALHNYVRVHAADGTSHVAREQICEVERRLAPEGFLRIHRSTIVNLEFVREVETTKSGSYVVILRSGQRLSVSRSNHAALFALFDSL
jgi:two-component system LytT family response regulator